MKFIYDAESGAGYMNLVEGALSHHRESLQTGVIADIDERGSIIGVEFSHLSYDAAAAEEQATQFIQETLF